MLLPPACFTISARSIAICTFFLDPLKHGHSSLRCSNVSVSWPHIWHSAFDLLHILCSFLFVNFPFHISSIIPFLSAILLLLHVRSISFQSTSLVFCPNCWSLNFASLFALLVCACSFICYPTLSFIESVLVNHPIDFRVLATGVCSNLWYASSDSLSTVRLLFSSSVRILFIVSEWTFTQ